MRGKEVCRTLKEIRAEIARQNDIPWEREECGFKGECRGTCPRCEAEVRQLEEALAKRRRLCKAVALAGVAAGMVTALSGCSAVEALIDDARPVTTPAPGEEIVVVDVDPQGNATSGLGVEVGHGAQTVYEVLLGEVAPEGGEA